MTELTRKCIPPLKHYNKIPVYIVEEHNDALQFIYSAIGGKKLPVEGTTLVHLDAHPDMLIDRKLKGVEARSGRKLLPLLQIENWILPAVAAGHIERVVWLRPPWAKQFSDGAHIFNVGDHPETGYLRVDSTDSYYLSDALYSNKLENKKKLTLTVAELTSDNTKENVLKLVQDLKVDQPYVLDIDLDFFSTGNPFLSLYENIGLYDRLQPIFNFTLPDNDNTQSIKTIVQARECQLEELEALFQHLEEKNDLTNYKGLKTNLYNMVSDLATVVSNEAEKLGEPPDWWAVFAGGCTRDQGGLPYHISTEEEIRKMIEDALLPLLTNLPPPVLITVARSTDDGYCPSHQVQLIQSLVLAALKKTYEVDEPTMYYLNSNA